MTGKILRTPVPGSFPAGIQELAGLTVTGLRRQSPPVLAVTRSVGDLVLLLLDTLPSLGESPTTLSQLPRSSVQWVQG